MTKKAAILLFSFFVSCCLKSQSLAIPNDIAKIVESIYAYKFKSADSLLKIRTAKLPNDNWTILSQINFYWWQVLSGVETKAMYDKVNMHINTLITKNNTGSKLSEEALYFLTNAYAFKTRVSLLKGNKIEALGQLMTLMKSLKRTLGLEKTSDYYTITSGLYYYFIDFCNVNYPISRPYLNSLPSGSMVKGISTLKTGADSPIEIISNECIYFLSKIYQETEKNFKVGTLYASKLVLKHPHNLLYLYNLFEMQLFSNNQDEAYKTLSAISTESKINHQLNTLQIDFFNQRTKLALSKYLLEKNKKKK
jgi:hypothetical protein